MNTFGRCITRLREQEGISQEKFAAKFGVSRQTVSQWELGEQRPREATLRKICRAYGVGMDYFYAEPVPCERVEGEVPPVADKKTAPEEVRACLPVWKRAAFWLALTLFSLFVIAAAVILILAYCPARLSSNCDFSETTVLWGLSNDCFVALVIIGLIFVGLSNDCFVALVIIGLIFVLVCVAFLAVWFVRKYGFQRKNVKIDAVQENCQVKRDKCQEKPGRQKDASAVQSKEKKEVIL